MPDPIKPPVEVKLLSYDSGATLVDVSGYEWVTMQGDQGRLVVKQIAAALNDNERLFRLLDCRAGKLLLKGKRFIVVAVDEPYFCGTFHAIKDHEVRKGRWTAKDEAWFRAAIDEWGTLRARAAAEAAKKGRPDEERTTQESAVSGRDGAADPGGNSNPDSRGDDSGVSGEDSAGGVGAKP